MTAAIEARMAAARASMDKAGSNGSSSRPSGTRSSLPRGTKGFESFDSFDPEFGAIEDERMRPVRPSRGLNAASNRMSNAGEQSQGKC